MQGRACKPNTVRFHVKQFRVQCFTMFCVSRETLKYFSQGFYSVQGFTSKSVRARFHLLPHHIHINYFSLTLSFNTHKLFFTISLIFHINIYFTYFLTILIILSSNIHKSFFHYLSHHSHNFHTLFS